MNDRDYVSFEVMHVPNADRKSLTPEFHSEPFAEGFPYPEKYRKLIVRLLERNGWNPLANRYWVRGLYLINSFGDTELMEEDWKPVN